MISFSCPVCGQWLQAPPTEAGAAMQCPRCQRWVTAPAAGAVTASGKTSLLEAVLPPRPTPTAEPDATLPPPARDDTFSLAGVTLPPTSPEQDNHALVPRPPAPEQTAAYGGLAGAPASYDFLRPPEGPEEMGRLGPYRILKVLGRGGMGIVFHAHDPHLDRAVALKVMLPELADEAGRRRFLREARSAAAIEHDHVIPIFQVGEDEGVPFLAMPLLKGETLEDRLQREGRLPVAEVLRVGRELALGLQAAHERGLVHRDIKPANVWLEGEPGASATGGRVKLLDFGLARAAGGQAPPHLEAAAPAGHAAAGHLTHQGAIVGTPAYMAPEQVAGRVVDHKSDLFSLGCVLYTASTGRLPFQGRDIFSVLTAVATQTPTPPRQLNPKVPPKLSELIMRLLAKEPGERPASAQAVADALDAITPSRRFRRRWAVAAAAALAAAGDTARLWEVSSGKELRSFSLPRRGEALFHCALHPDGKTLAVVTGLPPHDSAVWRYDTRTGRLLAAPAGHTAHVSDVAFSPDGRLLASASYDRTVKIWDLATRKELYTLEGHSGEAHLVAFSPDGKLLASSSEDGTIRVWDVASGQRLRTLTGHSGAVYGVVFSPDSKWLASAGRDNTARLWDVAEGRQLRLFQGHTDMVDSVAISPDGTLLATASWDRTARLWDIGTGGERKVLKHADKVSVVTFLPDGRTLATSQENQTIRLWDVESGNSREAFVVPAQWPFGLAVRGDGRLLASSGNDGGVCLWDLQHSPARRRSIPLLPPNTWVNRVAFSPQGRHLAAAGADGVIRVLKVPQTLSGQPTAEVWRFDGHAGYVQSVAVSGDGRHVLSGSDAFQDEKGDWVDPVPGLCLHDAATGKEVRRFEGHRQGILAVALSADGRRALSGSREGTARLWDAGTGKELHRFDAHHGIVHAVALSADGRRALTGGYDKTVRLWDADTGRELRRFDHAGVVISIDLSRDGKQFLSGDGDGIIRLWDAGTGEELRRFEKQGNWVYRVSFSPDGKQAVSRAVFEAEFRLWDVATGKTLRRFHGHTGEVQDVRFSADGRHILSAAKDGTVRLWDLEGNQLGCLEGHTKAACAAVPTPDGRFVISGGADRTVRLWRLPEPAAAK